MTGREGNRLVPRALAGVLAFALLLAHAAPAAGAQGARPPAQKLSRELLDKIPADLRGAARAHVRLTEADQARWLAFAPAQLRGETLTALARTPSAVEFVLRHLPREPEALNRVNLMRAMLWFPHWRAEQSRARPALSEVVLKDSEPGVVAQALDTLRGLEMSALRGLLDRRLRDARDSGDAELVRALAREHERWVVLERGSALPSFMRAVPPAFALKPSGGGVRALVFGDFGQGTEAQRRVAEAMLAAHRERAFDFGITVGDNFYPRGMESPSDPRWRTQWEDLYSPLGIEFYPSLGNHDWVNHDSVAAELLYAARSRSWRIPAPYYTFTAGPVQFFAVDTDEISEAQAAWLREELEKSGATWKVVYGHHPVFVSHVWGPTYTEEMRRVLWPLIKGRADVYLSGHHHSLQHLRSPEDATHFVTSGGGGAGPYPVDEKNPLALFARQTNGFTTLEATGRELTFKHFGEDGRELYSHTLRK